MRTLPPDELVVANTLGFQVLAALVVVGFPAVALLFVFLLVGSVLKSLLRAGAQRPSD
jgi:hypothetical protein